jgi:hypothetical protein
MATMTNRLREKSARACVWGLSIFVIAVFAAATAQTGCQRSVKSSEPVKASAEDMIGKVIQFNSAGNSDRFRVSGWSPAESQFTWSEGTSAKVDLPIAKDAGPLTLQITMAALIHPPTLPTQPVEINANGQKIADLQVGNAADFEATIPSELTRDGGTLHLELKTPKATSPKALGDSADPRVLGVAVYHLAVNKKP